MSRGNPTCDDQEAENSSTGNSKYESSKARRCLMCLRNRREAVCLEGGIVWFHKECRLWRAS